MKLKDFRMFMSVLVLGLLAIIFANSASISAQEVTQVPSVPAPVLMDGKRSVEGNSSIRVVNASPAVPSINIFLKDQSLSKNLAYGTYKDFTDFPTSTYTVNVTTPEGSAILSKEAVLAPDVSATFILTGLTNGNGKT